MPVRLGHALYKYVVYIRPFLVMLNASGIATRLGRGCFSKTAARPILPRSAQALGHLSLTAILRKATAEVWGQPANSQLYRQLTAGITENMFGRCTSISYLARIRLRVG